jgi:hypothetical protein
MQIVSGHFMKTTITLILITILTSCSLTKKTVPTNPIVTADNYFDYFHQMPGLKIHSFKKATIDSIISDYLTKRNFVIVRDALFEMTDKTIIPVSGYLPYEKIGYYIEPTFTYPKRAEHRTNPYYEFYKYSSDSSANILTFKDTADNLFVFKTNWYWWQEWTDKKVQKENKDKIIVTKEFAYRLLRQDIEKYFSNIEPRK